MNLGTKENDFFLITINPQPKEKTLLFPPHKSLIQVQIAYTR